MREVEKRLKMNERGSVKRNRKGRDRNWKREVEGKEKKSKRKRR